VRHLEHGYAQSHPAEDFAETLAVWLDPKSGWRTRYRDWPALDKLRYVDRLMREIARKRPLLRRRVRVEPLSAVKLTLGEYYEEKRRRYRVQSSAAYERDLKRLFHRSNGAPALPAASFIRIARPKIRKLVTDRTGAFQYEIDRVLREMIRRSAKLDLVADGGAKRPDRRTVQRTARQVARYLARGHHRHAR
jgi:hypothetical protein